MFAYAFIFLLILISVFALYMSRPMLPSIYTPWFSKLEQETMQNQSWRRVLATTDQMQVAAMSVPPGETLGWEVHPDSDQFFHITHGQAKISTHAATFLLSPGDAAIVPRGHQHNVYNTGNDRLQLYTIYAPPHHAPYVHDRTHADEITREG
jgi:mannose-6-phosphate isomerase-like protein (cupin superfamily)